MAVHISWRSNDEHSELLWRNWLARTAVNRKVLGSSPSRSDVFILPAMCAVIDSIVFTQDNHNTYQQTCLRSSDL